MAGNKKIPMRKCIGCGEMKTKKEMLRVIKTTEQDIELDLTGRKNGRGAYMCISNDCLEKSIKNRSLERSLKTSIPEEIYEKLTKELSQIGE